jgi:hypothetical protein
MTNKISNSDLTKLDLERAETTARRSLGGSLVNADRIRRNLSRLVLVAEGNIEDWRDQTAAVSALIESDELLKYLVCEVEELVAENQTLIALARTLLDQRDQAIDGRDNMADDLIATAARVAGIDNNAAYQLMVLLLNDDDTIMSEYDLGLTLAQVIDFREALDAALYDLSLPDEE